MKKLKYLFIALGIMVVISAVGGCADEGNPEFRPGVGIPWTFNVTNQSGSPVTVKVTPLRNTGLGYICNSPDSPAIVDGPIVEKSVAQGVSETMVIRTGDTHGAGLGGRVCRSFTFEITGLTAGAITSFGWPVAGTVDTTTQYYGLGYQEAGRGSIEEWLLSSLVSGHSLSSDPIYNVIVENPNSIKWSLDAKVKLDGNP